MTKYDFDITENSLQILNNIILNMSGKTFHNHYHILYDISDTLMDGFSYMEIGAFAGGSASLISSHPKAKSVVSIDLGSPIDKSVALNNVNKFKNSKCKYEYIQGDSTDSRIIDIAKTHRNIDLLFIDGNHEYDYVVNDFNNYKDLVSKNGYIVFDDYMDKNHSPQVKPAVDNIVAGLDRNEFEVIGSIKYDLIKKTNTPHIESSNLFVLRKKNSKQNIKFGIAISTYKRSDGRSPFLLNRALKSVFDQTYTNFKVFLIGDKYENELEVQEVLSGYDSSKIVFENLSYAKERDKYSGHALWSYGGVNAYNIAIDKAIEDGLEYICHLDHDDWWHEKHLELINKYILEKQVSFICTKSTYNSEEVLLPMVQAKEEYVDFLPRGESLIHSSVCMNFVNIPIRYRDLVELNGKVGLPADADMWERARAIILNEKLKSGLINVPTCRHDEEGFESKKI